MDALNSSPRRKPGSSSSGKLDSGFRRNDLRPTIDRSANVRETAGPGAAGRPTGPTGNQRAHWHRPLGHSSRRQQPVGEGPSLPAKPSVSVFFPTYNEEENIERAVVSAVRALERSTSSYEVIVVDDASTDRTAEIADRLAAELPGVRVVHLPRNLKLGGALKAGFAAATQDLVFYTDADNPIDFAEMAAAFPLVMDGGADIVTGFRLNREETWKRKVYSRTYNFLINRLFGLRYRDVNFSFKLFRRPVIQGLELRSSGSFIDAEILVEARRAGHRVREIGVRYFPRTAGRSTLASPGVIFKILREMAGYLLTRGARRRKRLPPAR